MLLLACDKNEEHPFNFYVESQDTFVVAKNRTTSYPVKVLTSDGTPQEVTLAFVGLPQNVKVESLTVLPDATDTFDFKLNEPKVGTYSVNISAYSAATGTLIFPKWVRVTD